MIWGKNKPELLDWFLFFFIGLSVSIPFLLDKPVLILIGFTSGIIALYLFLSNFEINIIHLLSFLIFITVLSPSISISNSFPDIRPEEFIIYLLFPFLIPTYLIRKKASNQSKRFLIIYFLFFLSVSISTVYGILFLNVPSGIRDYVELVKILKYGLIFLLASYIPINEIELKFLFHTLLLAIIISCCIGILQFFDIFGFANITGPIYLGEKIYKVGIRLTGTFTNPNSFSVLLGMGLFVSLIFVINKPSKKSQSIYVGLILAFLLCLVLSGSRTGLAAATLIVILILISFSMLKKESTGSIISIIILLAIGLFVGTFFAGKDILFRLQSGVDILEDESLLARFIAWYYNILIFLESPWIGWGPAKHLYTSTVDNEYILNLRRYGVLGLSISSLIYIYPALVSLSEFRKKNDLIFSPIIFFILLYFMINNLTNSVYYHIQTMDVWFIILGLYFSFLATSKKESAMKMELDRK